MSYDGALKMWDNKLQLVSAVKCAHEGARVHCLAIGPDGNLYTGGDDKVCWPLMVAVHSAGATLAAATMRTQRPRIVDHLGCVQQGLSQGLQHMHPGCSATCSSFYP